MTFSLHVYWLANFISHGSVNHGKHAHPMRWNADIDCLTLLGIATDGITALLCITIL
jgi:hypothetical protein